MTAPESWRNAHERAAAMRPGPSGPLAGLRIIDFMQALAGPFCTMLLADMGADVVKIEPPTGSAARFSPPYMEGDTERAFGGYFASTNRNKRSIVLDLSQAEQRETALRLIDGADAVTENFRAGVMDRLGLGWEVLRERNRKLVYGCVRGFGDPRSGRSPYTDWPAYDVVGQAMGGVVGMTGLEAGDVLKVGPSIGDIYPGTLAALGITAALLHAKSTGEGQFVDVAMYDSIVSLCEAAIYRYSYLGEVSRPMGNGHPQLSPFDVYPTLDGACAIAAPGTRHWDLLCGIVGRMDLTDDPRTTTNSDRVTNGTFVRETMVEWTTRRTTAEVVGELGGIVPVGPVNTAADLFADPHLAAREMLVAVEHPGTERPAVLANNPIRFSATPSGIYRRAPKLGEHTAEILAELEGDR